MHKSDFDQTMDNLMLDLNLYGHLLSYTNSSMSMILENGPAYTNKKE